MLGTLPSLLSLRVFEAAARHLSFKQAASELHVTPAAVSHQVKSLEAYLGTPLFRRLTRALELTEVGRSMLPRVQTGLGNLADAVALARSAAGQRSLRVQVPPSFATRWLIHRLQDFNRRHPALQLSVGTALTTVDSTGGHTRADDLAPLLEGELDLQIRFGHGDYPGLCCEKVFPVTYVAVCHPALLAGEHPLRTPADLRFHTLIHDDTARDRTEPANWPQWLAALQIEGVDASRGPRFSNSGLALEAAIDGMGVAISVAELLGRDFHAGRLVKLFDRGVDSRSAYYLVAPATSSRRAEIEIFRDWLASQAQSLSR